ncbi:MAG: Omp28-related outer membrane protein [Salinivirgaceae bacterium]|nr:Omp28-related outer membrane protein [Salinivirgaceae bacterium]MDD4746204.1 Omp28-related outer membrane protein [Salinivirgaceae bacterium]MDY0280787.1 Omp28-related outer membrane protein [Salinivirgaceae bacterium]
MKTNTILLTILIALLGIGFNACDKIEGNPYETIQDTGTTIDGDTVKRVLLIEFTGHRCTNCPQAHQQLQILSETYGERIIPIAIHSGYYSDTTTTYPTNYTTPFGDNLTTLLNIDLYPRGVVGSLNKDAQKPLAEWAEAVAIEKDIPTTMAINIESSIENNTVISKATITNTKPEIALNDLKLYAVLVEDSVVSAQLNNGQLITDYVHNHVVRHGFTSHLGEPFVLNSESKFIYNFPVAIHSSWRAKKLSVVVFVTSEENKIIQAAYKHIE